MEWAAEKYAKESRGYLIPGLLDGPKLAEEAAKLEGMDGIWEEIDYRDIAYETGTTRYVQDKWFLSNTRSEQDSQNPLLEI